MTIIGNKTFNGCSKLDIVLHDGITSIGDYAFSGTGLTQLKLPESLVSLGNGAFRSCDKIAGDVVVPSKITAIKDGVFFRCHSITSITLPAGITEIQNEAIGQCNALKSIKILAATPPVVSSNALSGSATIYVPAYSVSAYKTATNWTTYASRIQAIQE